MQEHIHTGFVAFLFAGLAALVLFNLVKLGSAYMVQNDRLEPAGKVLGSLVHFG